jgi:hypothetical protein
MTLASASRLGTNWIRSPLVAGDAQSPIWVPMD